ncbi:MAG: hypothetical protein Phyf2KO_05450 [Phycisphaerales bacterium]
MSTGQPHNPSDADRLLDLLTEHAATGLDRAEQEELDRLLAGQSEYSSDSFDEAAGALSEVFASAAFEPMPDNLRERCIGSAHAVRLTREQDDAPAPIKMEAKPAQIPTTNTWSSMGWVAAAACLMLAVFGWLQTPVGTISSPAEPWINVTDNQPVLASAREEFIRSHAEAIIWDWSKWGDEYADVTGDVVWDPKTNEGYMRFTNLPANDPQESHYQLWIVDQTRGTPLQVPPVDGGMFDVEETADGGEWIVYFKARLPVGDAFGFGVTLEGPDGAVVSDQQVKTVIAVSPPQES